MPRTRQPKFAWVVHDVYTKKSEANKVVRAFKVIGRKATIDTERYTWQGKKRVLYAVKVVRPY